MYTVVTTKSFDKTLSKIPVNWQKRIVAKIREVAADPYAQNNNLSKLQGRDGYRLRVGDWRIIYELQDECLVMLVLEMGARGGVTDAYRNDYPQRQGIRGHSRGRV